MKLSRNSAFFLTTLFLSIVTRICGEPSPIIQDSLQEEDFDPVKDDDDVASVLINTVYATTTPLPNGGKNFVPEIEMKKLKAASKGAGLTDAKAERVLRAVRALDLQYNDVVDLKKVMINPATSADYADRVRRALEEAVVDKHLKANDTSATTIKKTGTLLADSDLHSPQGRAVVPTNPQSPVIQQQQQQQLNTQPAALLPSTGLGMVASGPQVFFGTPLTDPALPEDLDNLWILASHVLTRKDAFRLVQLCYLLKITRSEVFDLQHEFASGAMNKTKATLLLQELTKRASQTQQSPQTLRVTPTVTTNAGNNQGGFASPDLSKPLDPTVLKRLQTIAELSGADKATSARLVRAVMNSGLEAHQVGEIGEAMQNHAASSYDISKLIDHLEETDLHAYRRSMSANEYDVDDFGEHDFLSTPEQAQGAAWIYQQNQ